MEYIVNFAILNGNKILETKRNVHLANRFVKNQKI